MCYLDTPPLYRQMGGSDTLGPYSSLTACESIRKDNFGVNGACRCQQLTPLPPNTRRVRFQLPADRRAAVDSAVLEYVKTSQLNERVQQSKLGAEVKTSLGAQFKQIEERFVSIRDRWMVEVQQGRQLAADNRALLLRLANEESNLKAQMPGADASPAQIAAFNVLVDKFNAKVDEANAATQKKGSAFVAAGTALAARFDEWKNDPRLRDYRTAASLAADARNISDPNLDPSVVDARNVKPFAPGEREAELLKPRAPARSLKTTAPPPPVGLAATVARAPLGIVSGKDLRTQLRDAYERYATGSTEEEKLKATAALEAARRLAIEDLQARLAHHNAVKDMLRRGREQLSKDPALARAMREADEARRAAEIEVDEMLQKGLRAADPQDLDLLFDDPSVRRWLGPKNPNSPLLNPLIEDRKRQELIAGVIERRRQQEALLAIFEDSDEELARYVRDMPDLAPGPAAIPKRKPTQP